MELTDRLERAVAASDEQAIRAILAGLFEDERAELQPFAHALAASEGRKGFEADLGPLILVAYGVLPVSDIRKLGWRSNHVPRDLDVVLRRRSPERLVPIVDHLLDAVGAHAWPSVRALVREGAVPRPDRASYTIAMLAATRHADIGELMAADPGLLEVEAWRLFEVEGGGEDSLAAHDKYTGDRWGDAFRALAAADPSLRGRLLDASLAALGRDFASFRAGWFSRFHESLGPTEDERAARVAAYLHLLRSPTGPTVAFAINALRAVQHAGRLPAGPLLDRIGPVLSEAAGGTARAALSLVAATGTAAGAAARAAIVAAAGLANPSPDVQRAALTLIGKLVQRPDESVAQAVDARLPEVAASLRAAVGALMDRLAGAPAIAAPGALGTPVVAAPGALAAPVASSRSASPLQPDRAIEPIRSIDDLVDIAVSVVESGEPADDIERVLDAVGRLRAERGGEFAQLTSSLTRRARTILGRRDVWPFTGFEPRADVAAVLLAWAAGHVADPGPMPPMPEPGAGAFLSARAREVAEAAAAGRSFVSVAAPTHRGGWIDPTVLVRRLAERPPASRLDLIAALLRLARDGREAARRAAADIEGEVGAVVRHALGGAGEPIGPTAPWWVAAARVRAPGQDDPAVEERHPGLGPEAGRAARMGLFARDGRPVWGGLELVIEPPFEGRDSGLADHDAPTIAMLTVPPAFAWNDRSEPQLLRWIATIQPGYREPWAAVGCMVLARNVDWFTAEWANRAFLEPFLDPATPIGPFGRTLVGIALGARDAGERGLAADVARLALSDTRLDGSELGDGLRGSAAIASDRLNRWAVSLADVAAESRGHAVAVAEAIGRVLPALADRPVARLVPVLRLLDELLAETGVAVHADARAPVEALGGRVGQAGRLARSILARG